MFPKLPLRAGGGSSSTANLQVQDASEGTTPKISVTNGQIYSNSSITPKINGTLISANTAPTLTLTAGIIIIYLKLTLDSNGFGTEAEIRGTPSASIPANSSTLFHIKIADVVVTIGASARVSCSPVIAGSLAHQLCGNSHLVGTL